MTRSADAIASAFPTTRRAAENNTQTALNPDDYTTRELRALGKTAHVPGYSRLRKAELATAIAAKRSPYSEFSDTIKKGIIRSSCQRVAA